MHDFQVNLVLRCIEGSKLHVARKKTVSAMPAKGLLAQAPWVFGSSK